MAEDPVSVQTAVATELRLAPQQESLRARVAAASLEKLEPERLREINWQLVRNFYEGKGSATTENLDDLRLVIENTDLLWQVAVWVSEHGWTFTEDPQELEKLVQTTREWQEKEIARLQELRVDRLPSSARELGQFITATTPQPGKPSFFVLSGECTAKVSQVIGWSLIEAARLTPADHQETEKTATALVSTLQDLSKWESFADPSLYFIPLTLDVLSHLPSQRTTEQAYDWAREKLRQEEKVVQSLRILGTGESALVLFRLENNIAQFVDGLASLEKQALYRQMFRLIRKGDFYSELLEGYLLGRPEMRIGEEQGVTIENNELSCYGMAIEVEGLDASQEYTVFEVATSFLAVRDSNRRIAGVIDLHPYRFTEEELEQGNLKVRLTATENLFHQALLTEHRADLGEIEEFLEEHEVVFGQNGEFARKTNLQDFNLSLLPPEAKFEIFQYLKEADDSEKQDLYDSFNTWTQGVVCLFSGVEGDRERFKAIVDLCLDPDNAELTAELVCFMTQSEAFAEKIAERTTPDKFHKVEHIFRAMEEIIFLNRAILADVAMRKAEDQSIDQEFVIEVMYEVYKSHQLLAQMATGQTPPSEAMDFEILESLAALYPSSPGMFGARMLFYKVRAVANQMNTHPKESEARMLGIYETLTRLGIFENATKLTASTEREIKRLTTGVVGLCQERLKPPVRWLELGCWDGKRLLEPAIEEVRAANIRIERVVGIDIQNVPDPSPVLDQIVTTHIAELDKAPEIEGQRFNFAHCGWSGVEDETLVLRQIEMYQALNRALEMGGMAYVDVAPLVPVQEPLKSHWRASQEYQTTHPDAPPGVKGVYEKYRTEQTPADLADTFIYPVHVFLDLVLNCGFKVVNLPSDRAEVEAFLGKIIEGDLGVLGDPDNPLASAFWITDEGWIRFTPILTKVAEPEEAADQVARLALARKT